jgi:hypothetical protein
MATSIDNPYLLEVFASPNGLVLPEDVTVVRGRGPEPRHGVVFGGAPAYLDIVSQDTSEFTYCYGNVNGTVNLRGVSSLSGFCDALRGTVYIDITALNHHIWAPILRTVLRRDVAIRAIYIEPDQYVQSPTGIEGEIFDLSERISGVAAIPGFASFADEFDDRVCFIPMLGFEGRRTAYILEQVQPKGTKIIPVIGLPGFKVEFPFYTFQSNARILRETQAWKNVVYAAANNPFSLFEVLQGIGANEAGLMKIAPIGTKPHALGAFLFPLKTSRRVEFVYDFPIRKRNRTIGTGKVFVYRISEFMRNTA